MLNPSSTIARVLKLMAEKKASDVYFSAHAPVAMRLQGECININSQSLTADAPWKLLSEILSPEQMQELEQTGELNTAVVMAGVGNFRISAMRQRGSYAAAIRFISLEVPRLESLNLPSILQELVMRKRGLILMVGASGTGKSTSMAAMLDYRNERLSGHILTIEDPIEYIFSNKRSIINQREVGSDTESLEVGLRNALRQSPDVIMIGEIRDRATMSSALAYAQSGHLVMATLHSGNSYQALNRILSFYPLEARPALLNDLSLSLQAVVSQRLLPSRRGQRLPAVEVLLNTRLMADLINQGAFGDVRDAMSRAMAEGSQSFEDDLLRLIESGQIDRAQGLAYADSPTNLLWRLQNQGHSGPSHTPAPELISKQSSFSDIVLDVLPEDFDADDAASAAHGKSQAAAQAAGASGFGASGLHDSELGGYGDSRIGDL